MEWEELKKLVWRRDNYTCQVCGKRPSYQVHHIIPRRKGGKDELSNLVTLCGLCHMLVSPCPDFAIAKAFKLDIKTIRKKRREVAEKLKVISERLNQGMV